MHQTLVTPESTTCRLECRKEVNDHPAFIFFLLMLAAAALVASSQMALNWDGSYYLVKLLQNGAPMVPHHRIGAAIFQAPAWLAMNFLADHRVIASIFSIPFALVPAVALDFSWMLVKNRQPGLFLWPVISIAVISIPAQSVLIGENLIACELAWPMFLAAVMSAGMTGVCLFSGLAILCSCLHPVSIFFLGLCAISSWHLSTTETEHRSIRRKVAVIAAFIAAARLIAFWLLCNDYEQSMLNPSTIYHFLVQGFSGPAIACCVLAMSFALATFVSSRHPVRRNSRFWLLFLLAAGASAAAWSLSPWLRTQTFSFGRWLFLPFGALMAITVLELSKRHNYTMSVSRWTPIIVAGALFLISMAIQSLESTQLCSRLQQTIATTTSKTLIARREFPWLARTSLDHWSLPFRAMLLQNTRTPKLVLLDPLTREATAGGGVRLTDWDGPFAGSWFTLSASGSR